MTFSGYTINGDDVGNYTLNQPTSTANITKAALTITASDVSMTYADGTALNGASGFTSSGLQGGDAVDSVTLTTNATTSSSGNWNAGSWSITPSAATGSSFNSGNYNITYTNGRLTVNQATPSVTVADASGNYSGSTFSATSTVAGVVSGVDDSPASSLEGVTPTYTYYTGTDTTGTPLAGAPSAPGTYTVVASFAGSTDYASIRSSGVQFTITPPTPVFVDFNDNLDDPSVETVIVTGTVTDVGGFADVGALQVIVGGALRGVLSPDNYTVEKDLSQDQKTITFTITVQKSAVSSDPNYIQCDVATDVFGASASDGVGFSA